MLLVFPRNTHKSFRDKEGHKILMYDAAGMKVDEIAEPDLIKTLVYCLERITERYEVVVNL